MRKTKTKISFKNALNKIIYTLGVLVIVGAIFFVSLSYYLYTVKVDLDTNSWNYVNTAMPLIISSWDYKELKSRVSNEFIQYSNDEEQKQLFEYFKENLGELKVYLGSQGEAHVFVTAYGLQKTATYTVLAEFEKGKAVIEFSLIFRDGTWQITGYQVQSRELQQ